MAVSERQVGDEISAAVTKALSRSTVKVAFRDLGKAIAEALEHDLKQVVKRQEAKDE